MIIFYFHFLSLRYGIRMRAREEEKPQESDDERWSMLDKRIERARARHELARLGMGTIFLVIIIVLLPVQKIFHMQ